MTRKTEKLGIRRDMRVSEIVALLPMSEKLLSEYGLHCFHCAANTYETLEEGCSGHGFTHEEIDDLVEDLNTLLSEEPKRPEILHITPTAAQALRKIADEEGCQEQGFAVAIDELGNFCMEFQKKPQPGDHEFSHPDEPHVRIFASTLTLRRIGGATIDFRAERFKLDLPEEAHVSSRRGNCACKGSIER
jgi:hybrid cluster-associated redox disulfide protein